MAAAWIETVTGSLEQKKRYREYKARMKALPTPYRTAMEAMGRYLTYAGGITKGDVILTMLDDLSDLFERAAADDTPVRDIVGEDPTEFAEAFIANYTDGQWINKERARLAEGIARAEAEQAGNGDAEHPEAGR